MKFLVDTNVVSEQVQKYPSEKVLRWLEENDQAIRLSVITIAEVKRGISRQPENQKKKDLQKWFDEVLRSFSERILPIDKEVALTWGEMYSAAQRHGFNPPGFDSLLAATALKHNLVVVTRNEDDFRGTGVKTINPWE